MVNLGGMMQAMSGDAYRSEEHRGGARDGAKMSLCYLAFPQDDAVIVHPSGYRYWGAGATRQGGRCNAGMTAYVCFNHERRSR